MAEDDVARWIGARWEYSSLTYWRVRPDLVEAVGHGFVVQGTAPWDWPWKASWAGPEGSTEDVDAEVASAVVLSRLGSDGWEAYHREVESVAWRAPNLRTSGAGIGIPMHQTYAWSSGPF